MSETPQPAPTNEKASHTPGTWQAEQGCEDDPTRWMVTAGPIGFHIATIENGAPGDSLETEAANARLIASAPDLLAALHAILDDAIGAPHDPLWIVRREFIDEARAAIAKAEGRPEPNDAEP